MKSNILLIFIIIPVIFNACSINSIVIRQMEPILLESSAALFEESDLKLAEQALASNLKLLEGLLKNDPGNEQLLLLAAQGYAGYALGFVEDEDPERAKVFYLRARDYALEVLRKDKSFAKAETENFKNLEIQVQKFGVSKVPALFWAGFSWAGYANLSLNNPAALADLPKIQLLMDRVEKLNPNFFNGAVYLYQGAIFGMKPIIMGGNPEKAKQYFEKNLELTDKKFLLSYIYMAKYYAAKILDEELFDQYLNYVEETSLDVLPEMKLLNQIAKQKAVRLLNNKEELF